MKQTITQFLIKHAETKPVSFHMPGHKGSRIFRENGYGSFLDHIMDCDITEIPGADNLFQPETIVKETMEKYCRLYDVKKTYLLINGSSTGLIASILAAVPNSTKLILARNCHKSIFNALALGNIQPVYAYPEMVEEYGILGAVSAEEIAERMDENPEAAAIVIPSPNYYGICSDIQALAEEVHRRGKILIVDQAHGAHLKFFHDQTCDGHRHHAEGAANIECRRAETEETSCGMLFPMAAETCGADLVINSTHKTLASWTQSAILNVCSDRVDLRVLEDKLQTLESSSPSYPLMASLDINADLLEKEGKRLNREWKTNLQWFYEEARKIPGLRIMEAPMLDPTKLNMDMSECGIDGNQLEEKLMERGIFVELVTGNIVMGMSGIGNRRFDYERLIEALQEISGEEKTVCRKDFAKGKATQTVWTIRPEQREIPIEKELIPLADAQDRICAASLIPYPPGIPLVCPGEVINQEVIDYVTKCRIHGEKVIGVDESGRILVGPAKAKSAPIKGHRKTADF